MVLPKKERCISLRGTCRHVDRCHRMAKEPVTPPQPPAEEPGEPYPVEKPPAPHPNEDRPLVDPVPPDKDQPRMGQDSEQGSPRGTMKHDIPSQPNGAPDQQPGAVRGA
jgi:hypothetical protein